MRVAVVCADRGIAADGTKGASVHLRSMADAFGRLGAEVTLFSSRSADSSSLPCAFVPSVGVEDIAAFNPDLVYERYSLGHLGGLQAAAVLGAPLALEVNAPLVAEATLHRPNTLGPDDTRIEDQLWRDADLIFAVSSGLRSFIAARTRRREGLHVVPNGVDPRLFAKHSARVRSGPPWRIAFLGHPKPWHGTARLSPLIAALIERGIDAKLVVIGGGVGTEVIVAAFAARGLSAHLEITGPLKQEEAIRRLADCDLSLAPYENDADFYFCPLKVVESMAVGLPLVAAAIGDVPRIAGETALLVEPGSDAALLAGVESLLGDESVRRRLGAAARERALSSLTWTANARLVLDATQRARMRP